MPDPVRLTMSAVKRAGRDLRHARQGMHVDPERLRAAYQTLLAFRAAHALPLTKANNGLRSMVRTEGCEVEVSQRLKRVPTIMDKLVREPTLPLSSMQDIGGCRAVLNSIDEVRRVEVRLRKNRPPIGYSDYISTPRSSGYRGVHVIVTYDDRAIEVQLRTQVMHAWAITVERLGWVVQSNLKGDGSHPVQDLMAAISEAMAIEEHGGQVPQSLLTEMTTLRQRASPYLEGRR